MMEETSSAPITPERLTVIQAGEYYIRYVQHTRGRKPSTVQDYEIMLKHHFERFFESTALADVTARDIERYIAEKKKPVDPKAKPLAVKTVCNHLAFLHGVYSYAIKKRWTGSNPVAEADRPRSPSGDPDLRFLDAGEVEALIAAAPNDTLGVMERVLYLTAATTGLRQGELIALRWKDVDWLAEKLRVRLNIVRGHLGTPKSKTSVRWVPMTARLARELDLLHQRSGYQQDEDYVFCHPETGSPYDASKMRKRFKQAAKRAGIRIGVRVHDLRHTFGTRMASVGTPMRTLQALMGHKSIQTTEIYADYSPSPHEQLWAEQAFGVGLAGQPDDGGEAVGEDDKRLSDGIDDAGDIGDAPAAEAKLAL
jgi:integrase